MQTAKKKFRTFLYPAAGILFFILFLLACHDLVTVMQFPQEQIMRNYTYAVGDSSPPGNLTELQWQTNETGEAIKLPEGSDMIIVRGRLMPGDTLLIPSFFGTVIFSFADSSRSDITTRATHFSGNPYYLLTIPEDEVQMDFEASIHLPFTRSISLFLLKDSDIAILNRFYIVGLLLGILLLGASISAMTRSVRSHRSPLGSLVCMMISLYFLTDCAMALTYREMSASFFTFKLLYFSSFPLALLWLFKVKYTLPGNESDILLSLNMIYGVLLLYYHSNEFSKGLLLFGMLLQCLNIGFSVYIWLKNRGVFKPSSFMILLCALIAFLILWISLFFGYSNGGSMIFACICGGIYASGMTLSQKRQDSTAEQTAETLPESSSDGYAIHFPDFEASLKKMGFDDETISIISRKCNTSSHHMQHVAEYTRAICIAMGFAASKADQISSAALLHDIGKLRVPEEILFSSEKLTDAEFTAIRQHHLHGYEILRGRNTPFFDMAAEVALQHHEYMDGSGYLNLQGGEICLPARIVAVADVFDALTTPRNYKEPWDFEAAFSHIIENSGSHFDSEVIKDFIRCKQNIRQLYDTFSRKL